MRLTAFLVHFNVLSQIERSKPPVVQKCDKLFIHPPVKHFFFNKTFFFTILVVELCSTGQGIYVHIQIAEIR